MPWLYHDHADGADPSWIIFAAGPSAQVGFRPGAAYRVTPGKADHAFAPACRIFAQASHVLDFVALKA